MMTNDDDDDKDDDNDDYYKTYKSGVTVDCGRRTNSE